MVIRCKGFYRPSRRGLRELYLVVSHMAAPNLQRQPLMHHKLISKPYWGLSTEVQRHHFHIHHIRNTMELILRFRTALRTADSLLLLRNQQAQAMRRPKCRISWLSWLVTGSDAAFSFLAFFFPFSSLLIFFFFLFCLCCGFLPWDSGDREAA